MEDLDLTEEIKAELRKRQTDLIKIVDALAKLEETKEWDTLKELIFDKSLQAIERQLLSEALSQKIDINKLYKLQGEWVWAKQYSDIERFADTLKKQLEDIKKKLK